MWEEIDNELNKICRTMLSSDSLFFNDLKQEVLVCLFEQPNIEKRFKEDKRGIFLFAYHLAYSFVYRSTKFNRKTLKDGRYNDSFNVNDISIEELLDKDIIIAIHNDKDKESLIDRFGVGLNEIERLWLEAFIESHLSYQVLSDKLKSDVSSVYRKMKEVFRKIKKNYDN